MDNISRKAPQPLWVEPKAPLTSSPQPPVGLQDGVYEVSLETVKRLITFPLRETGLAYTYERAGIPLVEAMYNYTNEDRYKIAFVEKFREDLSEWTPGHVIECAIKEDEQIRSIKIIDRPGRPNVVRIEVGSEDGKTELYDLTGVSLTDLKKHSIGKTAERARFGNKNALQRLEELKNNGCALATYQLGLIHNEPRMTIDNSYVYSHGVVAYDAKKAFDYFKLAAKGGNIEAQLQVVEIERKSFAGNSYEYRRDDRLES
jgi:TPR repeat protein